ncbi:hypothetical protein CLHUN_22720 [Ruminiclostridium hungatei]|uniref:Butirosin biosynthesis protein H N-terminal domain-containing protein n=1 Tax=Ruminiclostridium hungatei TaxID=48256 RepID=A0A1V4SIS1_RUMHU|nr:hypothetical protein [Ruminiclostridium hungatei]OPX43792.1 hypothetical protein CLHUN_22720 [Ruminiclostridium hungatei]
MIRLNIDLPPVIGYLHHAYLLSVAREHPDFKEWFNTNYIQMKYYPQRYWLNFHRLDLYGGAFDYCPLLDLQMVKNEFLRINGIDIVELAVKYIEQGYYIWLYIDEFYDRNRRAYNTRHFIHENLLHGFDPDTRCFYSSGFDQNQKYTFSETRYQDLSDSFNHAPDNLHLKILKPNSNAVFKLELENIKNTLSDYLNSCNTSKRSIMYNNPTSDCVYGLEIYKHLKTYFEALLNEKTYYDIRILHILWEHKRCMTARIAYLHETKHLTRHGPILNSSIEIENKVLMLRNLQMKYEKNRNREHIEKIIRSLEEISIQEAHTINELLANIVE